MSVKTVHNNLRIYGKVQGVFFRENAKEEAEKIGVSGFVENLKDGSVYVEIEGEKSKIDNFINWCESGSAGAEVKKVKKEEGKVKNFKGFEIKK